MSLPHLTQAARRSAEPRVIVRARNTPSSNCPPEDVAGMLSGSSVVVVVLLGVPVADVLLLGVLVVVVAGNVVLDVPAVYILT